MSDRTDKLAAYGLEHEAKAIGERLEAAGIPEANIFVGVVDADGHVSSASNFCCAAHESQFLVFIAREKIAGNTRTGGRAVMGEQVRAN